MAALNLTPVDTVLNDVENALTAKLYYAALVVALTVPEICAALQEPDGWGGSARYKAWYAKYLSAEYPDLTGEDCYSLRCSVLHQGKLGRPGMQYSRVLFTVPNDQQTVFHKNIHNDALNLDVTIFCRDMISAAKTWFKEFAEDMHVAKNADRLVQYRPHGLKPYMVGMPLIA